MYRRLPFQEWSNIIVICNIKFLNLECFRLFDEYFIGNDLSLILELFFTEKSSLIPNSFNLWIFLECQSEKIDVSGYYSFEWTFGTFEGAVHGKTLSWTHKFDKGFSFLFQFDFKLRI